MILTSVVLLHLPNQIDARAKESGSSLFTDSGLTARNSDTRVVDCIRFGPAKN